MNLFFNPTSKVQKDRNILRNTDLRMAKYSRRGLILNFVVCILAIVGSQFAKAAPNYAIVLTVGLLLITLCRGYILFRFDQLYPRAPKRWRDKYFAITLLGSAWWSFTVVSIIKTVGITHETLLIAIYSIIFFSTTAHAFSPYYTFFKAYQLVGIVPSGLMALIVGGSDGYIFGFLQIMFYAFFGYQSQLMSRDYWRKLELNLDLGKRALKDEEERISSKTKLDLSNEFLENFHKQLDQSLENSQPLENTMQNKAESSCEKLLNSSRENIAFFHSIVSKNIEIKSAVFNVRHEIQFLVSEALVKAERQHIQIETALSPNLPMRLRGDAERFGYIIRALLDVMINDAKSYAVILEVQFLRDEESAGELQVTARRIINKKGIQFFAESENSSQFNSLNLTVAKALAERMGGEVEVLTTQNGDSYIQFDTRLEIADKSGQMDFHKGRFTGEKILLVGSNPAIVDIKRQELDALGFSTSIETLYKRVKPALTNQLEAGTPIENVLVYHKSDSVGCNELLETLRDNEKLKFINKIISVSAQAQEQLIQDGFNASNGFYFVAKPTGLFELESTFEFIQLSKGNDQALSKMGKGTIIVVGEDASDVEVIAKKCRRLEKQKIVQTSTEKLASVLSEAFNPMAIIPCSQSNNVAEIVRIIRQHESEALENNAFIPIIGVGDGIEEGDLAAFEIGLDDYINLSSQRSKTLASMLRYWRSLDL